MQILMIDSENHKKSTALRDDYALEYAGLLWNTLVWNLTFQEQMSRTRRHCHSEI